MSIRYLLVNKVFPWMDITVDTINAESFNIGELTTKEVLVFDANNPDNQAITANIRYDLPNGDHGIYFSSLRNSVLTQFILGNLTATNSISDGILLETKGASGSSRSDMLMGGNGPNDYFLRLRAVGINPSNTSIFTVDSNGITAFSLGFIALDGNIINFDSLTNVNLNAGNSISLDANDVVTNATTTINMLAGGAVTASAPSLNFSASSSFNAASSDTILLAATGANIIRGDPLNLQSTASGNINIAAAAGLNQSGQNINLGAFGAITSNCGTTYNVSSGPMTLTADGIMTLTSTPGSYRINNLADGLMQLTSGALSTIPNVTLASGFYNPVFTNYINLANVTVAYASYIRLGDSVIVSISGAMQAINAGNPLSFYVTIPIPINAPAWVNFMQVSGSGAKFNGSNAVPPTYIEQMTANGDNTQLVFCSIIVHNSIANDNFFIKFTYTL